MAVHVRLNVKVMINSKEYYPHVCCHDCEFEVDLDGNNGDHFGNDGNCIDNNDSTGNVFKIV